jgi:hypothetical protein
MCWNYFASGHGKGKVDGADALVKCKIHKEQIKPHACKLKNVKDVTFCSKKSRYMSKTHCQFFVPLLIIILSSQSCHCYHFGG